MNSLEASRILGVLDDALDSLRSVWLLVSRQPREQMVILTGGGLAPPRTLSFITPDVVDSVADYEEELGEVGTPVITMLD